MKRVIPIVCLLLVFVFNTLAFADGVEDMLSGQQDLVILGSVKDITGDKTTVAVDYVLGRNGSELVGKDIEVAKFSYTYCESHSTSDFRNPIISDNIVISLNADENGGYTIANSAYKVDSNEYASCKLIVLDGLDDKSCIQEMQKVTCYIRANGMVSDFDFDSEGRIYAVYPQNFEQCFKSVYEDGTAVNPDENTESMSVVTPEPKEEKDEKPFDKRTVYAIAIIVAGALGGFVVVIMTRRAKTKM